MRNKSETRAFYIDGLGFRDISAQDYEAYLIVEKDGAEIHFFLHTSLDPHENYGQIYIRTDAIEAWHNLATTKKLQFATHGSLETKPWGQREFSLLDPDHNLITFGQEGH
jgi:catechol 2,3-dioxygenase-like lactoylglutathione lyase family enzyme